MRFGIDPARFGAEFRHHRLDFAELVGRILVENMQHAIARRAKNMPVPGSNAFASTPPEMG